MSCQDNLLDIVGDFRHVIGQRLCHRSFNPVLVENSTLKGMNFLRRGLLGQISCRSYDENLVEALRQITRFIPDVVGFS